MGGVEVADVGRQSCRADAVVSLRVWLCTADRVVADAEGFIEQECRSGAVGIEALYVPSHVGTIATLYCSPVVCPCGVVTVGI
jgi:hypothetical protein